MRSDSLRPALAAGLCIAAFAFGAATLSDAVVVSTKPNVDLGGSVSAPVSTNAVLLGIGLVFVSLLVGLYALGGRGISDEYRRWLLKGMPIAVGLLIVVIVVNHLVFSIGGLAVGAGTDNVSIPGAGDGGEAIDNSSENGSASGTTGSSNLFVTVTLLAALVLGVVAIVVSEAISDDDGEGDGAAPTEGPGEAASLGRAAGDAADRIEDGDADVGNEIYRAWREMVDRVDVENPRTSTPAEFAAAAADAGLGRTHVEELTELFEAVRYGERDVTEERERRAVEALREIEREYGDGGDQS